MNYVRFPGSGDDRPRGAHEAGNIHAAQYDQHKSHGKFHGKADARRDNHIKKNNGAAYDENGQSMADAPKNAGERGFQQIALPADDGGHGDDVIRIGGMPHAKKESDRDDRQKIDHGILIRPCLDHFGHA